MTSKEEPKEIEITLKNGVCGTISLPHSLDAENPYEAGFAPATHKVALILHGQGGHRNYCYQKRLAHKLAAELGIYSLRIDFRGCGNSAENADENLTRVISQDVEDIQECAEYLIDGSKNALGINFTLSSIIGHSRGSTAMFLWAIEQNDKLKVSCNDAIIVPNLINCCSRFNLHTVGNRYPIQDPDFKFVATRSLRYGKIQDVNISKAELLSLSTADLAPLKDLPLDISVLSIYGLEDKVIPLTDPACFANVLNRGYKSHHLELIPDADHNFYGVHPIENEDDEEEYNPHNHSLNSKRLVNYNHLVTSMIIKHLRPENELERFLFISKSIGEIPRWKLVDGVSNFRDVGGWKIEKPTFPIENSPNTKYYVKPDLIYRCANTAQITSKGKQALKDLNIGVMFDLRSDGECEKDGIPLNLQDYGIKRIHAPVFSRDDYSPQAIALRYTNLMTSWSTYIDVYENMLENGIESFKTIFSYIKDECKPFVFHCTAGKDRTGIIGMLILLLLGVNKHIVAKEYELTAVGLKPYHPILRSSFLDTIDKIKAKLGDNSSDIENLIIQGRSNWTIEDDGFKNLMSSRYETMLASIERFSEKYGGILGYMKNELNFSDNDILKIYNNLIVLCDDDKLSGFTSKSRVEWSHMSDSKAKF